MALKLHSVQIIDSYALGEAEGEMERNEREWGIGEEERRGEKGEREEGRKGPGRVHYCTPNLTMIDEEDRYRSPKVALHYTYSPNLMNFAAPAAHMCWTWQDWASHMLLCVLFASHDVTEIDEIWQHISHRGVIRTVRKLAD